MKERLRVLVVEDSVTVRKRLVEVLAAAPGMDVVGEAGDGKQAIDLCLALRPDVITMDMMLPVMTGLAATEYIMAHLPTPILVVSASLNRGEVFKTYDALAAGAVDVLDKPSGDEPFGDWERRLVDSVRMVSRIRVITHLRARVHPRGVMPTEHGEPGGLDLPAGAPPSRLVALGASTGGPGALVTVLNALPARSDVPILLTLHINEPFGRAFAEWLGSQVPHDVRYARDGEALSHAAGHVVVAPPAHHLVVRGGRLRLTRDPERHSCRPSVDVLFESLAQECGAGTAAALLTGMGRDGAAGLLAIRRAGGHTIAQDEASCVVYGMPREAVQMNAAQRVLPLADIGPALATLTAPARPV